LVVQDYPFDEWPEWLEAGGKPKLEHVRHIQTFAELFTPEVEYALVRRMPSTDKTGKKGLETEVAVELRIWLKGEIGRFIQESKITRVFRRPLWRQQQ
jgi:hypothetical protein